MTRFLLGFLLGTAIVRAYAAMPLPPQFSTPPALVAICQRGGLAPRASHLASGWACAIHDSSGATTTVGAISIYSDEGMAP